MKKYLNAISHLDDGTDLSAFGVYPLSIHRDGESATFMVDDGDRDVLVRVGDPAGFAGEFGTAAGRSYVAARLDHDTARNLRRLYPFCAPKSVLGEKFTFGVGDRLGLATPGHIRVFRELGGTPVFAQQSIRELNLTNRTFDDVLDAATFAVYREGFTAGYGADGDHLKTPDEVRYALSSGYTMVTLDCSEHIRGDVNTLSGAAVKIEYAKVKNADVEKRYLGRRFAVGGETLTYNEEDFMRMYLIYGGAVDFAERIFNEFFKGENAPDFEMSIDETSTPTTPLQHYFIASELIRRGVAVKTIAPRFCGEFQKGVDYVGDLKQFEKEYVEHTAIADHFGYKLSVHSGSDKFSVFPIVGRVSNLHVHVKTAGTNWLEAMRVVAQKDPALYRQVHKYALTRFADAKKFYHVTTDLTKIPDVDTLSDSALDGLFEENNARQLIHITYGFILGEKNADGSFRFKDKLYSLWRTEREAYYERLYKHIGRHVRTLMQDVK